VAVVVPARDEAASLPRLLADLAGQDHRADEVVVVDDQSLDGTADVARAAGVGVVDGRPLPAGWTGKPWACAQGVAATTAERLVFLDADVELAPSALAAVSAAHDGAGGLLSVAPRHRVGGAVEHLSLLPNVVALMGSGAALPHPSRRPTAFGPCLVTWRADYEAVGGHGAVRGSVLEDVDLGRAYLAAGEPVTVLGGADLVAYRMYPSGLRALVEGWTKNLAGGAARIPVGRTVLTVTWVTSVLSPTLALVDGGSLAAFAYVATAAQVELLGRRIGTFRRGVGLLHPVLAAAFVALFAGAMFKAARGRATWKGRPVALRR